MTKGTHSASSMKEHSADCEQRQNPLTVGGSPHTRVPSSQHGVSPGQSEEVWHDTPPDVPLPPVVVTPPVVVPPFPLLPAMLDPVELDPVEPVPVTGFKRTPWPQATNTREARRRAKDLFLDRRERISVTRETPRSEAERKKLRAQSQKPFLHTRGWGHPPPSSQGASQRAFGSAGWKTQLKGQAHWVL